MTSQIYLDSYIDAGVLIAMALVNDLGTPDVDALEVIAGILSFDPPSLALLKRKDAPGFVELARQLRQVFERLGRRDVDGAADILNAMLAEFPAHPHLAKEQGAWRMHHHPSDAELVPMYTSICAEGVARMIGGGYESRFGVCEAASCRRIFFDNSKNGTRRFCSVTCQNRVKTAAFRSRQASAQMKRRH